MADKIDAKVITGQAYWFKVLGKPVPNYNKDGFEWVFDVALDANTVKELKAQGLGKKIKNKGDERGDFIQFKRASVKRNGPKKGEANDPIRVIGPDGKTVWDNNVKVGNKSVIRVKYVLNETVDQRTKEKGMRADVLSVQVYQHVVYVAPERQEFEGNPEAQAAVEAAVNKDW